MVESVATARIESFQFMSVRAILAKCLGTAYPRATALHSANCRPIFMSCRVRGLASAARSNTTFRPDACSFQRRKTGYARSSQFCSELAERVSA
jgi:hypothetical protein